MADDKVIIDIQLNDGQVKSVFNNLTDQAKKSSKEASGNLESFIGSSFTKLGAAAVAAGGAIGAALFSKASISAAIEAEASIQRLNQSLANAGRFSAETSQSFIDLASEIQRTTTIEDDAVFSLAALANNFAKTNEQAQGLTKAAIELSAATGKDLNSSVEVLGKTLSGSAGLLSKQIPELQNYTKEQLKAGAAIDVVLSRFSGSAASQVNTFSGALTQAKNSFGDLLEEIGNFVVKDKVVVELLKSIAGAFNTAATSVSNFRQQGQETNSFLGNLIILTVKFAQAVNQFLVAPLELAFNLIVIGTKTVATAITGLTTLIFTGLSKLANLLPDFEVFKVIKDDAQAAADVLQNTLGSQFDSLATSVDNVLNLEIAGSTALFLDDLTTKLENAKSVTQDFKNNTKTNLAEVDKAYQDRIKSINQAFSQGLVNTVVRGVSYIGDSLVKGTLGFEAFAGTVLGALGDLSIQIGTNLIAQGIGINALASALASLNGAAAIAAGATLVALGSALKAIGGGLGGAGTPAAGTPGGSPVATTPATDTPIDQTVQERSPQNDVTVNIRGDVLDSDETGLRIVDIINSAFDKQGVVIKRGVTA